MELWLTAIGALAVALLAHLGRRRRTSSTTAFPPASTDVINAARIRVAGIGGLGLVAMAAVVALAVPSIGIPIAVSAVFGVLLALVLIALRRRTGPMPSSGTRVGANTVLSIDCPPAPESDHGRPTPRARSAVHVPGI